MNIETHRHNYNILKTICPIPELSHSNANVIIIKEDSIIAKSYSTDIMVITIKSGSIYFNNSSKMLINNKLTTTSKTTKKLQKYIEKWLSDNNLIPTEYINDEEETEKILSDIFDRILTR